MTHAYSTAIAAVRDTTALYECTAKQSPYSYTVDVADKHSYSSMQQMQLNAATAILQIRSHNGRLQLSPTDWTVLYNMLHAESNMRNLLVISDLPIVNATDNGVSRYNTSSTCYSLLELLFDWLRQAKTLATSSSSSSSTEQTRSLQLLCGAGSTSSHSRAMHGTIRIHDNSNSVHNSAAAAAAAAATCIQWCLGSESSTATASTTADSHHSGVHTDTDLSTSRLMGTRFNYHHDTQINSNSARCSIALVRFDESTSATEVHNSSFSKPNISSGCVSITPMNASVTSCTIGTIGPIIGYTTATTARVLIETSAACILTCNATPLSTVKAIDDNLQYQFGNGADVVTKTVHVVQGNVPAVFELIQLKPCTRYSISFSGLANEHVYTASVLTSCSKPYSMNIAVTWSINNSTSICNDNIMLSGWHNLLQQSALPNRSFDMVVNMAHISDRSTVGTQDHDTKAMVIAGSFRCATDNQQESLQYSTEIEAAVATVREQDYQQATRDVYRGFVSDSAYKRAIMSHTPQLLALSIYSINRSSSDTEADSEHQQRLSTLQRMVSKEYQQAPLHQQLQQQHSKEIANNDETVAITESLSAVVQDDNTRKAKSESVVYILSNTAVVVLDVYSNQTTTTTDDTSSSKQSELQPLLSKKQQKTLKNTLSLEHITALAICCAVPFVGNVIQHPQLPPMSEKEIKKSRKIMKERMIELEQLAFTAANSAHTITTATAATATATDDVSTGITDDNNDVVVAVESSDTIADNSTQPATIELDEALQLEYTKLTLLDKEQKRQLKSTGRYRPYTETLSVEAVGQFDAFHCEQRPQYQWGYHSIELAALLEILFEWQHTAQGRSVTLVCGGTYGTASTTITDIDSGSCIQQTCIGTISATGISEKHASAVCNWSSSGIIGDRLTYVHHNNTTDVSDSSEILATYGVITVATEPHCAMVNSHVQHCDVVAPDTATIDITATSNNNTVASAVQNAISNATTCVVSGCSAVLGPVIGRVEVMPVVNNGKESRYSCRVPLLLEIDKFAIVTCIVTDVLTAEVFKLSLQLQPYTARVFWMQGLRLSRRYTITFEGISKSNERKGILHTPSTPSSSSATSGDSGSGSTTAATDTTDTYDDVNIVFISGDNPGNSLLNDSSITSDRTTLWQSLAQQLSQPWHSITCIVHIGGQLNLDTAYSDSVTLMNDIAAQKQAGTLQLNGEKSALKAVKARFKSEYRAVWNVPSKQKVLATCSNIMLPSQLDVACSNTIQQQLIACVYGKWIQRVAESVCKEYQRQLWDMHWGLSTIVDTIDNNTTDSDKHSTVDNDDILRNAAVFQNGRICMLHLDGVLQSAQQKISNTIISDSNSSDISCDNEQRSNVADILTTVLGAVTAR
eukprot:12444-Heterococcus_DN1.PRE.1